MELSSSTIGKCETLCALFITTIQINYVFRQQTMGYYYCDWNYGVVQKTTQQIQCMKKFK